VPDGVVHACSECGLRRLAGDPIDYESEQYRELVDGDSSAAAYYRAHDHVLTERLGAIGIANLRDRFVVDVGAGAGSFLDAIRGIASRTVGVEPARHFRAVLEQRGHGAFAYARDALPELRGKADVVTTFAVIEHVDDAASFVEDLAALARPGGLVVIETPNARDWLIEFLPAYAAFFYRVVHRWYFDVDSLSRVMRRYGLEPERTEYRHRYDLSNALCWLRDRQPTGNGKYSGLAAIDSAYRQEIEATGRSDHFYVVGTKT
jgi:2-polyprenyl-3-methyl-5-hydroxy-6-metoxy-1,4-benzoquinol methylase